MFFFKVLLLDAFFGPYWAKGKVSYLSFYENRPLEIILWPKRQLNSFSFFLKRQLSLFSFDPICAKKQEIVIYNYYYDVV